MTTASAVCPEQPAAALEALGDTYRDALDNEDDDAIARSASAVDAMLPCLGEPLDGQWWAEHLFLRAVDASSTDRPWRSLLDTARHSWKTHTLAEIHKIGKESPILGYEATPLARDVAVRASGSVWLDGVETDRLPRDLKGVHVVQRAEAGTWTTLVVTDGPPPADWVVPPCPDAVDGIPQLARLGVDHAGYGDHGAGSCFADLERRLVEQRADIASWPALDPETAGLLHLFDAYSANRAGEDLGELRFHLNRAKDDPAFAETYRLAAEDAPWLVGVVRDPPPAGRLPEGTWRVDGWPATTGELYRVGSVVQGACATGNARATVAVSGEPITCPKPMGGGGKGGGKCGIACGVVGAAITAVGGGMFAVSRVRMGNLDTCLDGGTTDECVGTADALDPTVRGIQAMGGAGIGVGTFGATFAGLAFGGVL